MHPEQKEAFIPLLNFEEDYEILNQYPFTIRRKNNKYIIRENLRNGYVRVCLNNKSYQKHRLIALQFIPNPKNLPQVDHINHDKTNYHLSNLRWVSPHDNHMNKTKYNGYEFKYVELISDEAIKIEKYGKYYFKNYYYWNDNFYYCNGHSYKKLRVFQKNGNMITSMKDINNKYIQVHINKFKKEYYLT